MSRRSWRPVGVSHGTTTICQEADGEKELVVMVGVGVLA